MTHPGPRRDQEAVHDMGEGWLGLFGFHVWPKGASRRVSKRPSQRAEGLFGRSWASWKRSW
eukprot:10119296-Karenia_brevis.AAC.1